MPRFDERTRTWSVPVLCDTERGIFAISKICLDEQLNFLRLYHDVRYFNQMIGFDMRGHFADNRLSHCIAIDSPPASKNGSRTSLPLSLVPGPHEALDENDTREISP